MTPPRTLADVLRVIHAAAEDLSRNDPRAWSALVRHLGPEVLFPPTLLAEAVARAFAHDLLGAERVLKATEAYLNEGRQ